MGLYFLFGAFLVFGAVFGWVAIFKVQKISRQLDNLQKELRLFKGENSNSANLVARPISAESSTSSAAIVSAAPLADANENAGENNVETSNAKERLATKPAPSPENPAWFNSLKNNWMIWLGGTCVGLSGIFLVKYSVDQGILGPGARIVSGIIMGLVLHCAAEYLRRKKDEHPSFAALAAGGSITLFAALLSALHLYDMLSPGLVFILLALVAITTMGMALLHGPVLAVIGILGAYLVPILVGDGPGGASSVLIYALIISAAALLLIRYIYRSWLWLGVLAGGLGWWFLTLDSSAIDGWRGIYLTIFAYFLLSIPSQNWNLQKPDAHRDSFQSFREYFSFENTAEGMLPLGLFLIIACQFLSITSLGFSSSLIFAWSPLVILVLIAGGKNRLLATHSWALLLVQLLAWLSIHFGFNRLIPVEEINLIPFYQYCLVTSLIYSALAFYNYRRSDEKAIWSSLAIFAPLLFLALCFLLTDSSTISFQLGLLSALLGGWYLTMATFLMRKQDRGAATVWLFIGSHFAYSIAVAMFLREASMTLALSLQVISLSWVIRKFELKQLAWLLKVVVAIVILRLSLNPWLEGYPTDVHWSLWTYGGATLCCLIGGLQLKQWPQLRQWAYGATVHLFALTVWAETRYWLYDGNVYAHEYTLQEAALNLSIFGSLGLIYFLKQKFSQVLAKLYGVYSRVLLIFALLNYVVIVLLTVTSASWVWANVGETKIFNIMLLAFAMPVLLGYLVYRYYYPQYTKFAAAFTAGAGFIFISLQVRHFWHGQIRLSSAATDAELYTYSAVWLVMAVIAILGGVWRFGENCYRAGMLLLVVVIAKLFLVDMSDLEGLLRVASFMGMGLGLLAIAYLHQRIKKN